MTIDAAVLGGLAQALRPGKTASARASGYWRTVSRIAPCFLDVALKTGRSIVGGTLCRPKRCVRIMTGNTAKLSRAATALEATALVHLFDMANGTLLGLCL